jgi:hypothetical protein
MLLPGAAGLIALGDRMQWGDKHFRRELAAWSRLSPSQRQDGIPGYALNFSGLLSQVGLRVGRTFDLGNGQAASDRQLATGSPVLAVLGIIVDTAYDWLMAGQALARVLLYACSQGVWASYLNQPIEVPEVRLMLHNLLERVGFPQLLRTSVEASGGSGGTKTPEPSITQVFLFLSTTSCTRSRRAAGV